LRSRLDLAFEELGALSLKNIARPVEAFVLLPLGALPRAVPVTASMPDLSIAKAPRLSLVVLPLTNLGGDARYDYLADAITEDLTTDLSRLPGALVIARHSAATYEGKTIDIRRIGQELGVRYVIEGSVRKLDDMLQVNVQLVSTETNTHVWAGRFDQNVMDIGAGQEEIVSRLRAVLGVQMLDAESERIARERSNDSDTFDLLLRAWSIARKPPSRERLAQSTALFEQVLQMDPFSTPAIRGLSNILIARFQIFGDPDRGREDLIERVATLLPKAAAIEPNNELAIFNQGFLLRAQGRWGEAIATLERLLELFPNSSIGYGQLGFCKISIGRADEAIPLLQRALRLDPLSPFNRHVYARIGTSLLLLKREVESIEWQQRALAAGAAAPSAWRAQCYLLMASAHALTGHQRDAHRAATDATRLWPYVTVRNIGQTISPRGLPEAAYTAQMVHVQEGLRLAGMRDHADEDADFGVAPDSELHDDLIAATPTTVLGAMTTRTGELANLLSREKPILIDVALDSWGRSIPGAIGLQGTGHGASFSESVQARFNRKICDLTSDDLAAPIVAFCVNSERFTGYNLALRLVALGYSRVYWYRGGVEAWQVNEQPDSDLVLHDW
jgi:adenylate cyclase